MHILVLEGDHMEAEYRAKFGPSHDYTFWNQGGPLWDGSEEHDDITAAIDAGMAQQANLPHLALTADVIFDDVDWRLHRHYEPAPGAVVFRNGITQTLYGNFFYDTKPRHLPVYGFCGLPTLVNRPLLELTMVRGGDEAPLRRVCEQLGTDYRLVADRVGLATPRVLAMLINEACFTLQEGTAAAPDIDRAMQLGVNYPHGPLAWADRIGLEHVITVLDALWHDTHDPRYRACALLRERATLGERLAA